MPRQQDHASAPARRGACPVEPGGFALAVLALRTENYREAESRLRDLLACAAASPAASLSGPPAGPVTRDAARLLAEALYLAGRYDEALAACADARRHGWLAVTDPAADLLAGWVLLRRGQARPARDLAARHLRDSRGATGDDPDPSGPATRARLLHLRGMCDHRLGRPQAARRALRDAAALFRAADDPAGAAEALNALGVVEKTAVSLPAAAARFAEALRLNRAHGQPGRCAQNMVNLAIVRLKAGQTAAALTALGEAMALAEARNLTQTHLRARLVLARVHLQDGDLTAAHAAAATALADATTHGFAREQGLAHETLGDAAAAAGRLGDARASYDRALAAAGALAPHGDLAAETLRRLGELDLRAGDPAAAVTVLRRAVRAARMCGERYEEGCARRALAEAHLALAQWGEAYRLCRAALAILRDLGAALEAARCQLLAARVRTAWWRAQRNDEEWLVSLPAGAAMIAAHPRGHLEAAWSYAIEAFHGFESLGRTDDSAACAAQMDELRAADGGSRLRPPRLAPPAPDPGSDPAPALVSGPGGETFVAAAPAMRRLLELATVAAASDEPVLITGETGTGKELAARLVHARGRRATGPFVPVNCAAIPETLFEREFFGHARGAYTGADRDRPGLCESAHRGTLFLDEIGDLPLPVQAKLLRLLQEGTFRRLGETHERHADLRIIAATNADLPAAIAQHRFRKDLYYRLQTIELSLPPLRDRPEDLDPLIALFVDRALAGLAPPTSGRARPTVDDLFVPDLLAALRAYPWPGNVRELESLTRRLTLLALHAGRATPAMLPPAVASHRASTRPPTGDLNLTIYLAKAERDRIAQTLALHAGNRAAAARSLGISRNALYKKMERLGLPSPI